MKLVANRWMVPGRAVAMREGKMVWIGSITSPSLREIQCDELLLSPADYDAMQIVDHGLTPNPGSSDK